MATGFKSLLIAFLLVSLFFYAIMSFSINLSLLNNANQSLLDEGDVNKTFGRLRSNLSAADDTSKGQQTVLESGEEEIGVGELLTKSIKGVLTTFSGTISMFFNVILGFISGRLGLKTLDAESVILGTIGAILTISLIFYFWRLIKVGD